jgi:hypothetical protein
MFVSFQVENVPMGAYKEALERSRGSMSQDQIAVAKNQRSKARNAARKAERLERALIRQEARDARTAVQQIALLDRRLGVGKGAKKERVRLKDAIKLDGILALARHSKERNREPL